MPAGELKAQGIAPGFRFALLADEGFRVAARFLGQAQQAVAFIEQAVQFAGFAVDRRLRIDGALFVVTRGATLGFGSGKFGFRLRLTGLQGRFFSQQTAPFALHADDLRTAFEDGIAEQVVFQPGAGFAEQAGALVVQPAPGLVIVDVEFGVLDLELQAVELGFQFFQFATGGFLMLTRFLIAVEHFAVAENLKDQVEQGLGRKFAEFVGLALLQRQHLTDGWRQAGAVQYLLVFADAKLRGIALQGFDGRVAFGDQIMPCPFAAPFLDATGQCHRVAGKWWPERTLARRLAAVVHHPAQPAEIFAIAPHIAFVVALLRAVQRQQGAHGVEQRGFAGAIGADDGDDGGIERQQVAARNPNGRLQVSPGETSGVSCCGHRGFCRIFAVDATNTSASAPSRMRGAISA